MLRTAIVISLISVASYATAQTDQREPTTVEVVAPTEEPEAQTAPVLESDEAETVATENPVLGTTGETESNTVDAEDEEEASLDETEADTVHDNPTFIAPADAATNVIGN